MVACAGRPGPVELQAAKKTPAPTMEKLMNAQTQHRWVVGARLVWIEGGFEEGDITGVVREVAPDGASIRITWDDGEVDEQWWDADDDDLTPRAKVGKPRR
jgi:hypothetical protein